jgi:hypothetical protein
MYLPQCEVALAVTVSMALTVENPVAFAADDNNKMAVEAGIAAAASVDAGDVEAVLTAAAARRLQESLRRLQSGTVDVDATIYTDGEDDATALVTTMGAIDAAAMTAAIETAFNEAGINVTITVDSIGTSATQSANQAAAAATNTNARSVQGGDSGARKESVATGILAVFAVFAATM